MGKFCDECLPGYYGDALTEGCQICSCPLPIDSNKLVSHCTHRQARQYNDKFTA